MLDDPCEAVWLQASGTCPVQLISVNGIAEVGGSQALRETPAKASISLVIILMQQLSLQWPFHTVPEALMKHLKALNDQPNVISAGCLQSSTSNHGQTTATTQVQIMPA